MPADGCKCRPDYSSSGTSSVSTRNPRPSILGTREAARFGGREGAKPWRGLCRPQCAARKASQVVLPTAVSARDHGPLQDPAGWLEGELIRRDGAKHRITTARCAWRAAPASPVDSNASLAPHRQERLWVVDPDGPWALQPTPSARRAEALEPGAGPAAACAGVPPPPTSPFAPVDGVGRAGYGTRNQSRRPPALCAWDTFRFPLHEPGADLNRHKEIPFAVQDAIASGAFAPPHGRLRSLPDDVRGGRARPLHAVGRLVLREMSWQPSSGTALP